MIKIIKMLKKGSYLYENLYIMIGTISLIKKQGGNMTEQKTFIVGHRHPDTDSICSAIAYAYLKQRTEGKNFEPRRAGEINEETRFVLEYFDEKEPRLITNVKTQIKDVEYRRTPPVNKEFSLKKAWNMMRDIGVAGITLPAISESGVLEGVITGNDIASSYMNIYDSNILAKAKTKYSNIKETIDGKLIVGSENNCYDKGKVLIAAANPDVMENYIENGDLVILGNRYESQLCAIEMGASCLIVCDGATVSNTIKKIAKERDITIIATPFDTFTAARLINQAMPIKHFMTTKDIMTFTEDAYLDEVTEVMANVRHRYFPIVDNNGQYLGMISRRNLLGAKGKRIILVDHNEMSQAVEGMSTANVVEIIDHHRIGGINTVGPVYFRNQPLGCTATIIYQMYQEKKVKVTKNIAGLLCSAIISDTLLFRSPTCTEIDKETAQTLAKIAQIELEPYANKMFAAASNLKNKTDEQIFSQDYKQFKMGKLLVGIGQISSLNEDELTELSSKLLPYIKKIYDESSEDMMFFMLTNILEESTKLLCVGNKAAAMATGAFTADIASGESEDIVRLSGVVSRKKQLVPALSVAAQSIRG